MKITELQNLKEGTEIYCVNSQSDNIHDMIFTTKYSSDRTIIHTELYWASNDIIYSPQEIFVYLEQAKQLVVDLLYKQKDTLNDKINEINKLVNSWNIYPSDFIFPTKL